MAEPMYRRIAEDLRRRIESGELVRGTQLRSEVELREEYGQDGREVSRNTVRDAVKLLVARGLVEIRPGQGTFVVKEMTPFLTKLDIDPAAWGEEEVFKLEAERQGRIPDQSVPEVRFQRASSLLDGLIASQLQLGEGAQVISRSQERRIDGTPYSLQTTYYPWTCYSEIHPRRAFWRPPAVAGHSG